MNEVLTFENVVRDGTTGEQRLCKEETKELRIGGTMENQETELKIDRSIQVYGESMSPTQNPGNSRFVCCAVRR